LILYSAVAKAVVFILVEYLCASKIVSSTTLSIKAANSPIRSLYDTEWDAVANIANLFPKKLSP